MPTTATTSPGSIDLIGPAKPATKGTHGRHSGSVGFANALQAEVRPDAAPEDGAEAGFASHRLAHKADKRRNDDRGTPITVDPALLPAGSDSSSPIRSTVKAEAANPQHLDAKPAMLARGPASQGDGERQVIPRGTIGASVGADDARAALAAAQMAREDRPASTPAGVAPATAKRTPASPGAPSDAAIESSPMVMRTTDAAGSFAIKGATVPTAKALADDDGAGQRVVADSMADPTALARGELSTTDTDGMARSARQIADEVRSLGTVRKSLERLADHDTTTLPQERTSASSAEPQTGETPMLATVAGPVQSQAATSTPGAAPQAQMSNTGDPRIAPAGAATPNGIAGAAGATSRATGPTAAGIMTRPDDREAPGSDRELVERGAIVLNKSAELPSPGRREPHSLAKTATKDATSTTTDPDRGAPATIQSAPTAESLPKSGEVGPPAMSVENVSPGTADAPVEVAAPIGSDQPIDLSGNRDQFGTRIGERVFEAISQGIDRADIQVRPEGMGPIRIEIAMQGAEAHVQFHAANADTRSILNESTDALRGLLEQRGIQLGSSSVGADAGHGSSSGQPRPDPMPSWRSAAGASPEYADAGNAPNSWQPAVPSAGPNRGTIDLFA
ncbi:MAG: flagellar hook-length control protein FliK [Burkholderiaceae bacterium]